ncbi:MULTISPECIES: AraC family transcriptional regulator [Alphaproteobacteria]|uniref:Transcriptional regulator n=2 Tax=Alphaproteobacteria TaxID=28211 RepID=A0A512HGG0_9HYPH|nr:MULTISPECIES: AraC family transcriptional regulator [Alphaproteobacteria]GEO84526.1 transcriptional regulator [Ciceribacter naphthalenivorans]GLR22489.1 transcriptional regulator [Ciceribacter naphthalenivorans]GLT05345.1 transcriptional regulator [Sphingomonas psychrolutea]
MHNVSQMDAANDMPLTAAERTRFWRDVRFGGMECLSATFQTHAYAPHTHETFSIGAIVSGSQIARIRGAREQTGPGCLYLINPEVVHDGAPGPGGYTYRMIYPNEALFREVLEDVTGRACRSTPTFARELSQDSELAFAFHRAHRALEDNVGTLEAEESMYGVLTALILRHGREQRAPIEGRERTAVWRARDYLIANFATDIGLEELAGIARLSRAHLIRVFRKEFHITPHAFLTDVRIRRARALLCLGRSPADVAFACGFADQAHFTRHFKARVGVTPGQFRKR